MPLLLIADDDLRVLLGLSREFKAKGFEVDSVVDGVEAWARLREKPGYYDVLVTDMMMPEMDGFELLMLMRHDTQLQKLLVVVMLAEHNEAESNRLWKARAVPYLWGDEEWEWCKPSGEPFEAYSLTVYKSNRSGIFAAVAAALARYPRTP